MSGPARPGQPKDRLIVALDFPDRVSAVTFTRSLGDSVAWVKVGLELFCAEGPRVVEDLAALGKRIFLDLKFHDIPNTVGGAVRSAARLPVHLLTVHATAGRRALDEAARAQEERADLGVIAVTRLTSDEIAGSGFEDVLGRARDAAAAGLFGVVCPGPSLGSLRGEFARHLAYVVPGIRPAGGDTHDQVHVATPGGAVGSGADWIVVGRAITRAADPARAAEQIVREVTEGEAARGV